MSRMTKTGSIAARTLFDDPCMQTLGSRGAATLHNLGIHTAGELAAFLNLPDAHTKVRAQPFVGDAVAREIWRVAVLCAGTNGVPPFPEKVTRKQRAARQLELADQPDQSDLSQTVLKLAQQVSHLAGLLENLTEQHTDLCRRVDHRSETLMREIERLSAK